MEKKTKTLGKIKLNQFRKVELERREMNILKGGCNCTGCACGCFWDSTDDGVNSSSQAKNAY
jgi:natural product precursor